MLIPLSVSHLFGFHINLPTVCYQKRQNDFIDLFIDMIFDKSRVPGSDSIRQKSYFVDGYFQRLKNCAICKHFGA